MDKDYVDKFIKESLYNHETQIDNDLLWAAIEQKKTKGGSKLFGILGMLSVVLIAGFALFQMQNEITIGGDLNGNINAHTKSNSNSSFSNPSSNYTRTEINKNASQSPSLISSGEMNQAKENKITQIDENTFLVETENNLAISTSNSNSNSNSLISKNKTTISSNHSIEKNTFFKSDDSIMNKRDDLNSIVNFQNNKIESTDNSNNFGSNNNNNNNNINTPTTTSNESNLLGSSDNTSTVSNSSIEPAVGLSSTRKQIKSLEQLESQTIFLNNEALTHPSYQLSDCPTFGTKKRNLYLQAYTIFDFINYSFSSLPEDFSYRNERERTQSYSPSFRAGLQAKYLFKNGFYVKGGFEYGIARERYKDRIVDTLITIEPDQLISFFETAPGDTTFIYGNAPVTTISASNWNVQNSYKTIDIPVLVGYQINKGNWTYGLEIGVLNNIRLTTKSFILDTALKPRLAPEYYKSSIKQSLTGGINLGYSLTSDIKLLGLLQFKQNLSFINSNVNPIDQKNLHIGMGAGIEYRF